MLRDNNNSNNNWFCLSKLLKQNDKKTGRPKVWIYRDKATGIPKGEATITYEDEQAASSAIEWFNSKYTT